MRVWEAISLLIVSHLAVAGGVYALTDRRPVNTEVEHTGLFTVDATKVLATTVESLREENKLVVFTYKGAGKVQAECSFLWLFGGQQELSVPVVVTYHLDLSDLSLADVRYDKNAKVVTVKLPKVTLADISFQPENATAINAASSLGRKRRSKLCARSTTPKRGGQWLHRLSRVGLSTQQNAGLAPT